MALLKSQDKEPPPIAAGYALRFVRQFWRDWADSVKQQVLVGVVLAGGTLALQVRTGVIIPTQIRANALAVFAPYAAIVALFAVFHAIRTVFVLDRENQIEITRLRAIVERASTNQAVLSIPAQAQRSSPNMKFIASRVTTVGHPYRGDWFGERGDGAPALVLTFSNEPTVEHEVSTASEVHGHVVIAGNGDASSVRIPNGCWLGTMWNWVYLKAGEQEELILAVDLDNESPRAVENRRSRDGEYMGYGESALKRYRIPREGIAIVKLVASGSTLLETKLAYAISGETSSATLAN